MANLKGISEAQHRRLVSSLMMIEQVLNRTAAKEQDLVCARQNTRELEEAFNDYRQYLRDIEAHIHSYRALFDKVKYRFAVLKTKELKEQMTLEEYERLRSLI